MVGEAAVVAARLDDRQPQKRSAAMNTEFWQSCSDNRKAARANVCNPNDGVTYSFDPSTPESDV